MTQNKYIKGLVSVVIPTYNQALFIEGTLNSVIEQTYRNIEIIVADDCSTDGTIKILEEYSKKDKRIKLLLAERNEGIPGNFNKAFDAVTGEFVAFLGGDDWMYSTKIEKQVTFLKGNLNYGMVMHHTELYSIKDNKVIDIHGRKGKMPQNGMQWAFPFDQLYFKKYTSVIPSSCLARSEYYLSARYDDRLKLKHEILFYIDICMRKPEMKWGVVDEVLARYNYHSSNFSTNFKSDLIYEENILLATLAKVKYPQLARLWEKMIMFHSFNNIYSDNKSDKKVNYKKAFQYHYGFYKYVIFKIYFRLQKFIKI